MSLNVNAHKKIAQAWAKSGFWKPSSLVQHLPSPLKVKVSRSNRSFMYSEEMQRHLLKDGIEKDALISLTPDELFRRLEGQRNLNSTTSSSLLWHYFTSKLSDLSITPDNKFLSSAKGWEELRVDAALSSSVGNPEQPSIWIGGAGTSTTAHYDVMDNVFVQLHGRKKFLLWGPDALKDLHVYPDIHPRARKSQFDDVDKLVSILMPRQEIILEPGDTLYLPAFTFHQVEALDVSLSINLFSVCHTQLHGGRILSTPVPLVKHLHQQQYRRGGDDDHDDNTNHHTFKKLAERLLPIFGVHDQSVGVYITKNLLETRHRILNGNTVGNCNGSNGSSSVTYPSFDERSFKRLEIWWKEMYEHLLHSKKYDGIDEINGVRDIILLHLMESWALQLNKHDPNKVYSTLEGACAIVDR
jgi:hypothetical protein